jgi:hypothetical protein
LSSLIVPPTVTRLSVSATDQEILTAARDWADALAAQDYERAYGMTAHDSHYAWSASLIRDVIEGYGLPERHPAGPFRVTPLEDAKGGPRPRHEVKRYDQAAPDGAVAEVWFDLPLNGEWSDLTATFAVCQVGDDLVLCLNEIHVF